jgi:UDP-glucose 4-epimerase
MWEGRRPCIQGDGLQSRDFTYVANAVQAVVRAADAPDCAGKVYNIGNGETTTVRALVESLNVILETNLEPTFGAPRPGDVRHSQADISRARRELGYEPWVPFAEGLRFTVEALQGEPVGQS